MLNLKYPQMVAKRARKRRKRSSSFLRADLVEAAADGAMMTSSVQGAAAVPWLQRAIVLLLLIRLAHVMFDF